MKSEGAAEEKEKRTAKEEKSGGEENVKSGAEKERGRKRQEGEKRVAAPGPKRRQTGKAAGQGCDGRNEKGTGRQRKIFFARFLPLIILTKGGICSIISEE